MSLHPLEKRGGQGLPALDRVVGISQDHGEISKLLGWDLAGASPATTYQGGRYVVAGLAPARLPHAHGETFLLLPTLLGDTLHPPFANFCFKNSG